MYLDTCRPETVLLWYFNDKLITTFYYVLSIYSIYTKVILNKKKERKRRYMKSIIIIMVMPLPNRQLVFRTQFAV